MIYLIVFVLFSLCPQIGAGVPATDSVVELDELRASVIEATVIAARLKELEAREYIPHKKGPSGGQMAFHKCTAPIRALFTGNRFGKSRAAAQEWYWWCMGNHPYRETYSPPVRIRVVADGYHDGVDKMLLPIYRKIVDPADLKGGSWDKGYSKQYHTLTFNTGSTIEFMSYNLKDMGRGAQAFAGVGLDGYQQEEHGAHSIWGENQARIGSRPIHSIVTLTPILGKTWEHDEIYEKWQQGVSGVECFVGDIHDNPHISEEAVKVFLDGITDPKEREVREHGLFLDWGGMVYAMWDDEVHFIPYNQEIVSRLTKTVIIDPHPSKPTAVLWCGIDRDQRRYAYREILIRAQVPEIADMIRRESATEDVRRFIIDPKWGWVNVDLGTSGKSKHEMYQEAGIPVEKGFDKREPRRERVRQLLDVSPTLGTAGFSVMRSCPRLKWEFEHKRFKPQTDAMREADRWATIDEDDDLLDCVEYYVMTDDVFTGHRYEKAGRVLSATHVGMIT